MTLEEFRGLSEKEQFKWFQRYRKFKHFYREHKSRQKSDRGLIEEKLLKRYREALKYHYFRLKDEMPRFSMNEILEMTHGDALRTMSATENYFLSKITKRSCWTGSTMMIPSGNNDTGKH